MSWMSPTTSSGRLFQTCTAAWMNVLPEETVLELGIVRAWQGMETLERVALRMTYGCGSKAFRSGGHKLVCILYKTVAAATWRLWWRDVMFSLVLASTSLVPMIRRAFLWIESSKPRVVGLALIQESEAYSITLCTWAL